MTDVNAEIDAEMRARRRELLRVEPSPDPRYDYLAGFDGQAGGGGVSVVYVPDRLILTGQSVAAYLAALPPNWSVEALALAVLDDLNNELVPRWARVTIRRDQPLRCWAAAEDRQPGWDNPTLPAMLQVKVGG